MQLQYTYKAPTACQSPLGKAVYANLTVALHRSLKVVPGALVARLADEETICTSRPAETDQGSAANYEVSNRRPLLLGQMARFIVMLICVSPKG